MKEEENLFKETTAHGFSTTDGSSQFLNSLMRTISQPKSPRSFWSTATVSASCIHRPSPTPERESCFPSNQFFSASYPTLGPAPASSSPPHPRSLSISFPWSRTPILNPLSAAATRSKVNATRPHRWRFLGTRCRFAMGMLWKQAACVSQTLQ